LPYFGVVVTPGEVGWMTPEFYGWVTREDDRGCLVAEPAVLRGGCENREEQKARSSRGRSLSDRPTLEPHAQAA
jgi:hypothetical protein